MQNFVEIGADLKVSTHFFCSTGKHPMEGNWAISLHFPKYNFLLYSLWTECEWCLCKVFFASRSHFVRTLSVRPINQIIIWRMVLLFHWCNQAPSSLGDQWYLSAYGPQWLPKGAREFLVEFYMHDLTSCVKVLWFLKKPQDFKDSLS